MQGKSIQNSDTLLPANGWVKFFTDGTIEEGWDSLIKNKQASWRGGRNKDIKEVSLVHNGLVATIVGEGIYWQSDDWEVALFTSPGYIVKRRIGKQINDSDNFLCLYPDMDNGIILVFLDQLDETQVDSCVHTFEDRQRGQWVFLELDVLTNQIGWYIREDKI